MKPACSAADLKQVLRSKIRKLDSVSHIILTQDINLAMLRVRQGSKAK